jgi:hypothetical protein
MGKDEKKGLQKQTMRPIRVRSIHDAERLLARVLMQLQKEDISEGKAKTFAYVANSYAKMLEVSEFDKRITELENMVRNNHN